VKTKSEMFQGSLFEEDYLLRTLGSISNSPDVALTELVANAWDAGAAKVEIFIPESMDGELTVRDDGCGMTREQFEKRWMTLGYNRIKHQGVSADFPPERATWRRSAYGRNGMGRHGLLCFASKYHVETKRDGMGSRFVVATSSGTEPFTIEKFESFKAQGHGTILTAIASRNVPSADRIRDVLSARFLHDPQFSVHVNGKSVPLSEHTGLIDKTTLKVNDALSVEAYFIDSTKSARTTQYQGIAFWVGGRLVGEPSWILGNAALIDGRTRIAKRHTVVIKSDGLYDEVQPDWSAFKSSKLIDSLFQVVSEYVGKLFIRLSTERIQETRDSVLSQHRETIEGLQPLARLEIREFVDDLTSAQPMMTVETVSVAVQAVINLEKSRSGMGLLEKLSKLSDEDVEGLDRLLGEWTVRDALTVLDEIDRRVAVLQAIVRFSADQDADELHTLHPLVSEARWLFGPEFDSAEYASNVSLQTALKTLFKKRLDPKAFLNPRKRPDLLILSDSTICGVSTDAYDNEKGLSSLRDILLIELKRGRIEIGREEVHQATDYVEDLTRSGHLDGAPFIRAFVVGHTKSSKVEETRKIGDSPVRARIDVTTYNQLVRTGEKRLFRLKEKLAARYEELSGVDLFERATSGAEQLDLLRSEAPS
jgi:Histidine kinase-, DNA gyrase B-, and HSP90-like ATPase